MLSKEKQDELTKMLLTPIKVDKLATSIKKRGNTMISPQIYKGVEDPDMSDLSVDFYEIIYKDILPQNKIGENKVLGELDKKMDFNINAFANSSFAGDTMNSFKTISGKVIKVLTIDGKPINSCYYIPNDSEGRLRLILDSDANDSTKKSFYKFYNLCHSLANFWIIPKVMGRESAKTIFIDNAEFKTQDYMEKFLNEVKNDWDDLKRQKLFSFYFKTFDDYSKFIEKHFITETDYLESQKDKTGPKGSLNENDAIDIVSGMINAIENRAVLLSKSKYARQLWNLLDNISTDINLS